MKRFAAIVLTLALLLSLSGCVQDSTVTYYYVRDPMAYQYEYGTADGVMVGEKRDAGGHASDLRYLLILYFHGPVTDYLESPFPSGTGLEEVVREGDALRIRLSGIVATMEGTDLTLACACLARTCFAITDVQSVTITSESLRTMSVTMERDSLLLVDDTAQSNAEEST